MKSLKVAREQAGSLRFKDMNIEHGACPKGKIKISEVEAILDRGRRKQIDQQKLFQLECQGCHRRVWISPQSDEIALIESTAVDGEKREIKVYDGNLIDQNYREVKRLLNAEEIEVSVERMGGE